ncbi:MAG: multicopper oxidase domain-containing protein [Cyclobacteriaceae bacterium]
MNDTPHPDESKKPKRNVKSRRGFFKDAALGIGGIALVSGSLASCDSDSEGNNDDVDTDDGGSTTNVNRKNTLLKNGTPPEVIQEDSWFAPKEINFNRTKKLKSNPLRSTAGGYNLDNLYQLEVDKNRTGAVTGPNSAILFAYNGTVPGPTIRIGGDQELHVILKNALPGNNGAWAVAQNSRRVHDNKVPPAGTKDWQIKGHLYGPHQQHTTNLHTHGLHVSPGTDTVSQKKTQYSLHSDNVLLRVIPYEDYENRVLLPSEENPNGPALYDNEQVEEALYRFKLPRPDGTPHYPGTHWYHPHPHGATYDQVASGMAGFLIVEGPVDTYLKEKYKDNDYEELPLLIQRIFQGTPTEAEDSKIMKGNQKKTKVVEPIVNGQFITRDSIQVPSKKVAKNKVLRLRVLNGSVDGQGYIRFMLTKGSKVPDLLDPNASIYKNAACVNGKKPKNASAAAKRWCAQEDHGNFQCLNNIAFDGINLFNKVGEYTSMPVEWLTIGVANRADFLFAVPDDAKEGNIYTVWAQDMTESVDQQKLVFTSKRETSKDPKKKNPDEQFIKPTMKVAQFVVTADENLPKPGTKADGSLALDWVYKGKRLLAEKMLMPIKTDEITIKNNSERTTAYLPSDPKTLSGDKFTMSPSGNRGKIRARRILYSGFGHNTLTNSIKADDANTLYNAMVIDGKKYGADTGMNHGWDKAQHKMQVNTAEEWTVYNYSMTILQNSDKSYTYGTPAYQKTDAQTVVAKAVHHPFHIHQNPFYVRSLQDHEGNELLPLDEKGEPIPRWQDTIYLPHNGGRAIFRSRFWDYTGKYVNHCHLLQHEDWGMMQAIEVVDGKKDKPNYLPLPTQATIKQDVFPPLSLKQMYLMDIGKVDMVIGDKQAGTNDAAMLCYDPEDKTYFDQDELKDIDTGLKIPVPDSDKPFPQWNNSISGNPIV